MSISPKDCCILNAGNGEWAFAPLARQLSTHLGIDIAAEPSRFNYMLHVDDVERLDNASMGPRPGGRGNRHPVQRRRLIIRRFNGAATRRSRKYDRLGVGLLSRGASQSMGLTGKYDISACGRVVPGCSGIFSAKLSPHTTGEKLNG